MTQSISYMRIIMSVGMIAFVAALGLGATGAFFSDTETSTGNIFTAGSLDLKVDSVGHVNGLVCFDGQWTSEEVVAWNPDTAALESNGDIGAANEAYNAEFPSNVPQAGDDCASTWTETDLGIETFFNFADLKPGDNGENTISLHVYDNDAYACVIIDDMVDNDNGLTEPEEEDGDQTGGDGEGELSQELRFFAWADDGDNIWEPESQNEPMLFSNTDGPASDVIDGVVYPLFTPDNEQVMVGSSTYYIGLYWCYGDISTEGGELSCDGSEVTNVTQTDSLEASLTFYVEQARNNEGFECPGLPLPDATVTESDTWSQVDSDGKAWFAKARNNNGGFEVAVGTNDAGPEQDTADTTWVAGASNDFTLEYDGAGTATLTTGGQVVTYAVGMDSYSRVGINVKAPAGETTSVANVSLNTVNPLVPDSAGATGAGANDVNSLTIESNTLSGAWILTGSFTFSDVGGAFPDEYPAVQFSID